MDKSIIFIEVSMASSNPNLPSSGIDALQIASSMGYKVIVLSNDPEFYNPILGLADQWIQCDTYKIEDIINICKNLNPVAILTFSDLFVNVANVVSNHFNLKSVSDIKAPAISRNKAEVRKALDEKNVPNIKWEVMPLDSDISSSPIGYPCIIKPVDGSASWDVQKVENDYEMQLALSNQRDRKTYGRGVAPKRMVLFEEEIIGDMYSVEGFVEGEDIDLWGFNDRLTVPPPYYYEVGSSFFIEEPVEGTLKFCKDVLQATGYDFGPFHLEFIVSDKGPRLVELNPRLIGGGAHQCINYSCEVNIVENILKRYLSIKTERVDLKCYSAMLDIYPSKEGTIKNIKNIDKVLNMKGIKDIRITKNIGDQLKHPKSNSDTLGYVLGIGLTHEESIENVTKAAQLIEITME